MREVFLRCGSRIWSDAHSFSVLLIGAALIGRRVFLFTAAVVIAARAVCRNAGEAAKEPPSAETLQPVTPIVSCLPGRFLPPAGAELPSVPDVSALRTALTRVIVGQHDDLIETLMLGVIAGGHVLLEGAPGLGKTIACIAIARALNATFSRIQCNADLTPADILGCEVFDPRDLSFKTRFGPIFANVVLVDEINRAPARAQAALLEAMEDCSATIGAAKHAMPDPFLVLATMNEAETDGVFPLPAAQLDRFLIKTVLDFPSEEDERAILARNPADPRVSAEPAVARGTVRAWRAAAEGAYCAPRLQRHIVDLVRATRTAVMDGELETGAGPRAGLAILRAARARAILGGRNYVLPDDVLHVAIRALRHRVTFVNGYMLSRVEREDRLRAIVARVPSP